VEVPERGAADAEDDHEAADEAALEGGRAG